MHEQFSCCDKCNLPAMMIKVRSNDFVCLIKWGLMKFLSPTKYRRKNHKIVTSNQAADSLLISNFECCFMLNAVDLSLCSRFFLCNFLFVVFFFSFGFCQRSSGDRNKLVLFTSFRMGKTSTIKSNTKW